MGSQYQMPHNDNYAEQLLLKRKMRYTIQSHHQH
jgi:hypothetical protein